jgi:mono/diheme cytochrome c family protein
MGRWFRQASLGFCLALGAGAACADPPSVAGSPSSGHELARTWCGNCHQIEDSDKARDTTPSFRTIANDPAKDADYLRGFLHHPHSPMPPLELSRLQIEDLVAYIGTMKQAK